jgi:DNA polymerase-1
VPISSHRHPDPAAPRVEPARGWAGPLVPTSPYPCPACQPNLADVAPLTCGGCLGRGQVWLPDELLAHPGSLGRVLEAIAADARAGSTLPGARLCPDGRVAYGTWDGVPVFDVPASDPRRRPPHRPLADRLFADDDAPREATVLAFPPRPKEPRPMRRTTPAVEVPLAAVDGHNLAYRATLAGDATADGPGRFLGLLRSLGRELRQPAEWVVCFDAADGAAARQAICPAYKRHRPPLDPRVATTLVRLPAVLKLAGIAWLELPGVEADDLIASVAALQPDRRSVVVSSDRDFTQLVSSRVRLLDPGRRPGERLTDAALVQARYRIAPAQWCDYRALCGDPSDGLAGMAGVGPVGAARLLAGGLVLEDLVAAGRLVGRLGRAVASELPRLLVERELHRLRRDLPLPWRPTGTPSRLPQPTAAAGEAAALPHPRTVEAAW